jgi:hypothetical protein
VLVKPLCVGLSAPMSRLAPSLPRLERLSKDLAEAVLSASVSKYKAHALRHLANAMVYLGQR